MEELKCPTGTIRKTVKAYDVDIHCEPCQAGYYCLEGSSTESGPCETGYYCPTNFTNPYGLHPPTIGSYGARQVFICVNILHWFIDYFFYYLIRFARANKKNKN